MGWVWGACSTCSCTHFNDESPISLHTHSPLVFSSLISNITPPFISTTASSYIQTLLFSTTTHIIYNPIFTSTFVAHRVSLSTEHYINVPHFSRPQCDSQCNVVYVLFKLRSPYAHIMHMKSFVAYLDSRTAPRYTHHLYGVYFR